MEQRFEKLTPQPICGLIVKYLEIEESGFGNKLERRFSRVPVRALRRTVGSRPPGCGGRPPSIILPVNHKLCNVGVFQRA